MIFDKVPIWIQLWELPSHCKMKEVGRKVGTIFGKVIDAGLFSFNNGQQLVVKVLVEVAPKG